MLPMQLDTPLVVPPPQQRAAPIAWEEHPVYRQAGWSFCLKEKPGVR